MPKPKSKKTNTSPSPEISTPTQPAIVRIVKQNTNSPAPSDSSSTTASKENQNSVPELHVFNNQSQSKEEESSNSTSQATPDAGLQKINAAIDSSDFPSTAETGTVIVLELTKTSSSKAIDLAQPELEKKQPQREKRIPPYKKLETATNSSGQTFTVKEKIEVSTCNFGFQKVFIISLYSAPDGSIWAYYDPVDKNQRQLWKRGCCRIEDLKKLSMRVSNG